MAAPGVQEIELLSQHTARTAHGLWTMNGAALIRTVLYVREPAVLPEVLRQRPVPEGPWRLTLAMTLTLTLNKRRARAPCARGR